MISLKEKLSTLKARTAKPALEALPGFTKKPEQYCAVRLDGTTAAGEKAIIKLYTNGTLYIQAASDDAMAWLVSQLPTSLGLKADTPTGSPSASKEVTYPHIGTDESGKGDYFGPLVVCGVLIPDEETANELKAMGVRDGKTVTDKDIARLANAIEATLPADAIAWWVREPVAYNEAITKANAHGQTLNHVLACGHGTVISELTGHYPNTTYALVDQFAQNTQLVSRAAQHAGTPTTVAIKQETKAERHLAVAAASILARHQFLETLRALGDEIGTTLPKGAGSPVTSKARSLVRSHGPDILKQVAKWHFKTTQSVCKANF